MNLIEAVVAFNKFVFGQYKLEQLKRKEKEMAKAKKTVKKASKKKVVKKSK